MSRVEDARQGRKVGGLLAALSSPPNQSRKRLRTKNNATTWQARPAEMRRQLGRIVAIRQPQTASQPASHIRPRHAHLLQGLHM